LVIEIEIPVFVVIRGILLLVWFLL